MPEPLRLTLALGLSLALHLLSLTGWQEAGSANAGGTVGAGRLPTRVILAAGGGRLHVAAAVLATQHKAESRPRPLQRPAGMALAAQTADSPAPAAAPVQQDAPPAGADRYYAAAEVDQVALPRVPIVLPAPDALLKLGIHFQLKVFIDEEGRVDSVLCSDPLPGEQQARIVQAFRLARFEPARLQGRPVKSFKVIDIRPETDGVPDS